MDLTGMDTIAREVLEQTACAHCGRPLSECDGRHVLPTSIKHNVLCPLCGGKAHGNDATGTMAFRCAMRQACTAKGLRFDERSDVLHADQVRALAEWLELPGRVYGKAAAAMALSQAGVTGIAAARVGKRQQVQASAPVVPTPLTMTPPTAPPPAVPAPTGGKFWGYDTPRQAVEAKGFAESPNPGVTLDWAACGEGQIPCCKCGKPYSPTTGIGGYCPACEPKPTATVGTAPVVQESSGPDPYAFLNDDD